METPAVSVICLVYNMKEYLRDAFEGFLMQKTDFPFEVIVHDDASTDGSTQIVREYAEKYPDIFIPIIQTENQYSIQDPKNRFAFVKKFVWPRLRGEYIAHCEGDDYWTDPLKLQKQYDFMKSHPEYTLCAAKVRQVNYTDPPTPDKLIGPLDHTGEVTMAHILRRKEKQTFATCSLFQRKDTMMADKKGFPDGGDRPKVLWQAVQGKVWYINDEVGVYRRGRPGSWTNRNWFTANKTKVRLSLGYIGMYDQFNEYTERKYDDLVQEVWLQYMKMILRANGGLKVIKKGERKECYQRMSPARKRKLLAYYLLLPVIKVAAPIRNKIRSRKK